MINFKFLILDQIIFRYRSLLMNAHVSWRSDVVSIEEGWGTQGTLYTGHKFSASKLATKVCRPELINSKTRKFNKQ